MTGRTMTIQTQTPGGQDQPIPVKDAVEALEAALEVCAKATPMRLTLGDDDSLLVAIQKRDANEDFILAARAGYAGVLEYLLYRLGETSSYTLYRLGETSSYTYTLFPDKSEYYAAISAIVAWWRQSGAQGGGK